MSVRRACHSARAPSSGVAGTLHGPAIDLKPQYQTTTTGTLPEWQTNVEGMERARARVNKADKEAEERVAAKFAKLVTLEPWKNAISDDEVDAYARARGRFESMLNLYKGNKNSFYPLEETFIDTFVKHFPMNEDEKRIMENRRAEIQSIRRGTPRPPRNLLSNFLAQIKKIFTFKFQRS
jgi:hypothetical protein